MTAIPRKRPEAASARRGGEAGFTLVEFLVAAAMSIVLLGTIVGLLTTAVRSQPQLDAKASNIQTARYLLERLTREIRNGLSVENATGASVSFRTYVRRSSCGGASILAGGAAATLCEVTYSCSGGVCSRIESNPGIYTGTSVRMIGGLSSDNVFSYSPSAAAATYIGVTLTLPNPSGSSALTVSDGASLRNAILSN